MPRPERQPPRVGVVPCSGTHQRVPRRRRASRGRGRPVVPTCPKPIHHQLEKSLSPWALYSGVVMKYARSAGLTVGGFRVDFLRAAAATNTLDHQPDIAKVQEWLGHANIATTTHLCDRRKMRAEDSPTIKFRY